MSRSCNGGGVGGVGSWPIRGGGGRRAAGSAHWSRERLLRHRCGGSPHAGTSRVRQRIRWCRLAPMASSTPPAPPGLGSMRSGGLRPSRGAPCPAQERRTVVVCRSAGASRRFGAGRAVRKAPESGGGGSTGGSSALLRRGPLPWWPGCCLPLRGLVEMRGGSVSGLAPLAGVSPRRRGASPTLCASRAQRRLRRRVWRLNGRAGRRSGAATSGRGVAPPGSPSGRRLAACSGSARCRGGLGVAVAPSAALAVLGDRPTRRSGASTGQPALVRGVRPCFAGEGAEAAPVVSPSQR